MKTALTPFAHKMIAHRAAHKRALSSPMIGIPMHGDPVIGAHEKWQESRKLLERRACQYAAIMAQRNGQLQANIGNLDAHFSPQDRTVIFIKADTSQATVLEFRIPDHVMDFNPNAECLALAEVEYQPEPPCDRTISMQLAPPAFKVAWIMGRRGMVQTRVPQ